MRSFAGKPLVFWALKAAMESEAVDEVWLNTDSDELEKVGREIGAQIYRRHDSLTLDSTTTEEILADFVPSTRSDLIAVINPTNPLIQPDTIDKFLGEVAEKRLDTAFSVSPVQKHIVRNGVPLNYSPFGPHPRTQDVEKVQVINWAIVCWNRGLVLERIKGKGDSLYLGRTGFLDISSRDAIDIDSAEDFKLAETLAKSIGFGERN